MAVAAPSASSLETAVRPAAEGGMEWVACNGCGADDAQTLWRRGRFRTRLRTVVCRRCGLVYTNPRMEFSRYERFYVETYRQRYGKPVEPTAAFRRAEQARAESITAFLGPRLPRGGSVLEIGARSGEALHLLQARYGCAVAGVEPDRRLAAFGSRTLGLPVVQGLFERADYPDGSFDLVILCHVLEHCYSPRRTLEKIRRLLTPCGAVYVEVPNLETPYGSLSDYFQEAHPYTFSPVTLQRVARAAGFAVLRAEPFHPAMRVLLEAAAVSPGPEACADDYRRVLQQAHAYQRRYWGSGQWAVVAWQRGLGKIRGALRKALARGIGSAAADRWIDRVRGRRRSGRVAHPGAKPGALRP